MKNVLTAVLLLTVAGCNSESDHSNDYGPIPETKAKPNDLVGLWHSECMPALSKKTEYLRKVIMYRSDRRPAPDTHITFGALYYPDANCETGDMVLTHEDGSVEYYVFFASITMPFSAVSTVVTQEGLEATVVQLEVEFDESKQLIYLTDGTRLYLGREENDQVTLDFDSSYLLYEEPGVLIGHLL